MHVMTIGVTNFLVVAMKEILSFYHLPRLIESTYTRTELRAWTYQAGRVPEVHRVRPSSLHQYLWSLVDFMLYVHMGFVNANASFSEITKERRTIFVVTWFSERPRGIYVSRLAYGLASQRTRVLCRLIVLEHTFIFYAEHHV